MSDLPEVNTRAGFLAPGWRVWRFGRWHTITAVQASPPRNMYAAEPPEEQQAWLNVADQAEAA